MTVSEGRTADTARTTVSAEELAAVLAALLVALRSPGAAGAGRIRGDGGLDGRAGAPRMPEREGTSLDRWRRARARALAATSGRS